MPDASSYCAAYQEIEARAVDRCGAPLPVREIIAVLGSHADTAAAFKRISDELDVLGKNSLDDELIAERLRMPRKFVAALFTALRVGVDELVSISTVPLERIPAAGPTRH